MLTQYLAPDAVVVTAENSSELKHIVIRGTKYVFCSPAVWILKTYLAVETLICSLNDHREREGCPAHFSQWIHSVFQINSIIY